MAAVARHLRLPRHTFDTHLAYNTKARTNPNPNPNPNPNR